MNGIVGLWHLDEPSGTSGSGSVIDASGSGLNATPGNTSGQNSVTFGNAGQIGNAAKFNGSSSAAITFPANPAAFHLSTVSFQLWAKSNTAPSGYLGLFDKQFSYGVYLINKQLCAYEFLQTGPLCPNSSTYPQTVFAGDGKWHHIVFTLLNGAPNSSPKGTAKLYLDGKLVLTAAYNEAPGKTLTEYAPVIGSDPPAGNSLNFNGMIQEVAVWNRVLQPSEVLQLYRRGGNRMKYQVRSCSDSTCSGGNPLFTGPDGTNGTYFSELNNKSFQSGAVLTEVANLIFSSFTSVSLSANRFFQYRAVFESNDSNNLCDYGSGAVPCSPELKSVTISGTR